MAFTPVNVPTTGTNPKVATEAGLEDEINRALTEVDTSAAAAITALIDGAPTGLNTLNELAAAIGDDPGYSATVTAALALKAALASPTFTGVPAAPTAAPGTNTTQIATTAFVEAVRVALVAADALKANLAGPTFTGVPAAPTAAPGTNTTQIATTAFVEAVRVALAAADASKANIASPTLTGVPAAPTAAPGTSTTQIATTAFARGAAAEVNDALTDFAAAMADGTLSVVAADRLLRDALEGQTVYALLMPTAGAVFEEINATTTASLVGARVGTWRDPVSGFSVASPSTGVRPLLGQNSLGGRYLDFDGSSEYLETTTLTGLPTGNTPCEIMVLCDRTPGSYAATLLRYGGVAAGEHRSLQASGADLFQLMGGGVTLTDTSAAFVGANLVGGVWQATDLFGHRDGGLTNPDDAAVAGGMNTGTTRLRVGALNATSPSSFWRGKIYAVLITAPLPDAVRAKVQGILAAITDTRWKFPLANPYARRDQFSADVTKVLYFPIMGQSNSNGNGSEVALNTSPIRAGQLQMWNGGVRPMGIQGNSDINRAVTSAEIQRWIDLVERDDGSTGQTIASTFGDRLLDSVGRHNGVVVVTHGIGGASYDDFKKGSLTGSLYANMIAGVTAAINLAGTRAIEVPAVLMIAGETDWDDTQAEYLAKLLQFQADADRDIRALTGQVRPVRVILDQMARYNDAGSRLGQLAAALQYPDRFTMVGPKYHLPVEDDFHLTGVSTARRGAEFGAAARAVIGEGQAWLPLYCTSAVRTGASVVLTFAGNDGPLVLDTTIVSSIANSGLAWAETGGSGTTISGVSITGTNQITVTLSGTPTGTAQQIKIGQTGTGTPTDSGPVTGPRTNIRDSSVYSQSITDELAVTTSWPLYKWACHQVVSVTV